MTETWKETSTSYTNPQMSVASLWKLSQPTHLHPHFHWLTFTGNSSPYTPPSRPSSSLAAATQGFAPLLASALLLWVLLGSDLDLIRQPRSLMLCVCVHTQTLSHFSHLREDWTRGGGGDKGASLQGSEGFWCVMSSLLLLFVESSPFATSVQCNFLN